MKHPKKYFRMFPNEPEHRGNDKNVARNFSLEMNLVHKINEDNQNEANNTKD